MTPRPPTYNKSGMDSIIVTGGAGFIGANFVRAWLAQETAAVVNIDALTYAGNLETLADVADDARYQFIHADITDRAAMDAAFAQHQPRAVVHFAAESHVDRSIHGPEAFVRSNVQGTFTLLEAARHYLQTRDAAAQKDFRFLHVSTDEVYGSLEAGDAAFTETHPYRPNSPYAASKAASDHLARAWFHTYGLPVITTHCSNNYGPYQFPEKLIPLMIVQALAGQKLPIYGDGMQVRDWLHVDDHCHALRTVLARGVPGETYNIGGWNEKTNREIVHSICAMLNRLVPAPRPYEEQIAFVADRAGHDRRYAVNAEKIARELGWKPAEHFESGLEKTVRWYLDHPTWVAHVQDGSYRDWLRKHDA